MTKKQTLYRQPDNSRIKALTGTPLASFTRRSLALLIDFLIAGITFILLTVGVLLIDRWLGILPIGPDAEIKFSFFENWYSVIWLVLYFTISVHLSNGQTVGKKLCRIRIVSLVHDRVGLWHSFERALGYGASALEFGFGFFQYFIRPDRRTIHDRIAETIVIAEPLKKTRL